MTRTESPGAVATLWGLSVGDLFRSSWYGTERTYRVLRLTLSGITVTLTDGSERQIAQVHAEVLPEPDRNHPRDESWKTLLESDGHPPLELGGWGGDREAYPIVVTKHADFQLDLFSAVHP